MLHIREEVPDDRPAIHELNRLAFGGNVEADLIDRLRQDGAVLLSLVAVEDGDIVGHILFSRVLVSEHHAACSLAPMAVHPDKQRQGIGTALVQKGLQLLRDRGERIALVLGHPDYYPKLGFSAQLAKPLENPWHAGEAWMAMELVPGSLKDVRGWVAYPAAFNDVT